MINDQDRGPAVVVGERLNGEQLLIDAEDANLVENELEFGNEEGENIEIEGPAHPDPLEHDAQEQGVAVLLGPPLAQPEGGHALLGPQERRVRGLVAGE